VYNCEKCGQISKPREKCYRVVTKTRLKLYENGEKISCGQEIVEEKNLCKECAKRIRKGD